MSGRHLVRAAAGHDGGVGSRVLRELHRSGEHRMRKSNCARARRRRERLPHVRGRVDVPEHGALPRRKLLHAELPARVGARLRQHRGRRLRRPVPARRALHGPRRDVHRRSARLRLPAELHGPPLRAERRLRRRVHGTLRSRVRLRRALCWQFRLRTERLRDELRALRGLRPGPMRAARVRRGPEPVPDELRVLRPDRALHRGRLRRVRLSAPPRSSLLARPGSLVPARSSNAGAGPPRPEVPCSASARGAERCRSASGEEEP